MCPLGSVSSLKNLIGKLKKNCSTVSILIFSAVSNGRKSKKAGLRPIHFQFNDFRKWISFETQILENLIPTLQKKTIISIYTGLVADLPLSTGDAVETAIRLTLPPGYTRAWRAAVTAHRLDCLRHRAATQTDSDMLSECSNIY